MPLKLYGKDLSWVSSATHLGHELHYDCKCKRGRFIGNSLSIRETFGYAQPAQVLKAVQVYCCRVASYGTCTVNKRDNTIALGTHVPSWCGNYQDKHIVTLLTIYCHVDSRTTGPKLIRKVCSLIVIFTK